MSVKTSYKEDGEWVSVPYDPEKHAPKEISKTRKVGMTTAELIEMLREMDPEGTAYVSVGKAGAFDIEPLPYYYDGRLRLPVFYEYEEESWRGKRYKYRKIVGDEQATGGSHIMIQTKRRFGDDYVFEDAAEGYLFEYSFKNVQEYFLGSARERVWDEVKQGLQFQLDYRHDHPDTKNSELYGLKTKSTLEWIIKPEELNQDLIDSLDQEKFWNLVKEKTSLDLFD